MRVTFNGEDRIIGRSGIPVFGDLFRDVASALDLMPHDFVRLLAGDGRVPTGLRLPALSTLVSEHVDPQTVDFVAHEVASEDLIVCPGSDLWMLNPSRSTVIFTLPLQFTGIGGLDFLGIHEDGANGLLVVTPREVVRLGRDHDGRWRTERVLRPPGCFRGFKVDSTGIPFVALEDRSTGGSRWERLLSLW